MSRIAITGLTLANVKDYGAIGDGTIDDTAAIQAAIDDAIAVGLGGIFFPAGVFRVSLTGLSVSAATGFHIAGADREQSKVAFLTQDHLSTARQLLSLTGVSTFVTISDLGFDGNSAGITNSSAESVLLDIDDATDVIVENCVLTDSTGRAARTGDAVNTVTRVKFDTCLVFGNANSGLEFNDGSKYRIENCDFNTSGDAGGEIAGSVLVEPSTAVIDVLIEGCNFDQEDDIVINCRLGTDRLRIVGCTIVGEVAIFSCTNIQIDDNYLRITTEVGEGSGNNIQLNDVDKCVVQDNIIEHNKATDNIIAVSGVSNDVTIDGNILDGLVAGGSGVRLGANATNCKICNNIISGFGAGGVGGIRLLTGPISDVAIHGNQIIGTFTSSIELSPSTGAIGNISIQDNEVNDVIRLLAGGGGYTDKPVISGNFGGATPPVLPTADLANLPEPAVIIGGLFTTGAATADGATQFMGSGNPEGAVTGNIGDTYVDVDSTASGLTFFVKETGAGTTTGWVSATTGMSPPEKWVEANVGADTAATPMSALVSTNFDDIKAIRPGSITGLSTRLTAATAGGTITATVTINSVAGTLAVASTSVSNISGGEAVQAVGVDAYVAGDLLGIQFVTVGYTPIANDLEAWLEVKE